MQQLQELLATELVQQIRQYTFTTEEQRQLSPEVLEIIYRERWFQLLSPAAAGGLEWALPQTVYLFEALARADANVGWCVNLGAGANMFAGYLEGTLAYDIFHDPRTCCAGSGAVSGEARRSAGGYILSGRWKYASGANHATHFTANAWLLDETGKRIKENGADIFRSFIVPASHIINHNNWNAIGLKGTSSNDFEAKEIFVPDDHVFTLLKPSAFARGPLYAFPFAQLAVVNMTCMATGIALHFIDLYTKLAAYKTPLHSDRKLIDNSMATGIFHRVTEDFYQARTGMYEELESVWAIYEDSQQANEAALKQLSHAAGKAAQASRAVFDELYPLCGMSILDPATELNKVWRDGMTALQHYLLSPLSGGAH